MISVKSLNKNYDTLKAVKEVSFEVSKGEIVGLLGHNGAGKTTVMKIITGYLEPTDGQVTVGGKDVLTDRLAVQTQIGYMPENAPLYPEMLVQEYLLMMAQLRHIPKEKQIDAVIEAATSTGIQNLLARPISTLSKGYKQRVGLCQAIIHKPAVLILDEPTNGLDPVQIMEIRGLIKKLAQKSTVILSTHILPEIEAVCDRVIILINGEVSKDSSLADILSHNSISLSLPKDTSGVEKTLSALDTISSVKKSGDDPNTPNYEIWTLTYTGDDSPIPAIVSKCNQSGWQVGTAAHDVHTLENVFRSLMASQAKKNKTKENAA